MKFNTKLVLAAVFIALMMPLVFMAGNTGAAGTVWPNVNIWFSANEINSDGGWEITDPSCVFHPEAQTQSQCIQILQPAYTDLSTCQTSVCADGSAKTTGFCNAAGWSMVNRGTWQNVCSAPAFTSQISCIATPATWTSPSGPCSNPAYTTAGTCTTGYNASGNTWFTGGCSNPSYTTASTCTINTWTAPSGPCSNPAYTTQPTCSLATWGPPCSNPAYSTAATCTTGAALSNNTWNPTPFCSNPSYSDAISCSTVSTGNTWAPACTATWITGTGSNGAGYYGTLALCSDPNYTSASTCTSNGGDWQQLWSGNYNGGCARCHDYASRGNNSGTENGITFPMTAHKNALRRVTPGIPLGGPDWTSTNSTVPAAANLSGVSSITYEFPDVSGAAPYATDLSSAQYIIGGWYRNVKKAQILRTPVTSNEPVIMTDDTCAECHATGYVGKWGVGVGREGLTGGTNKWLYDGVQCGVCHSSAPIPYSSSNTTPMDNGITLANNTTAIQICTGCHQQRAGVALQPYQLAVNGVTGEFSGYAIGNQYMNSPHGRFSGTAAQIGNWTKYDSRFSNTSTAVCSDPQYTTASTCTAVSGNTWGGQCSNPAYTTASTCTTVPGNTWTLFASNNGCLRCHESHIGSVDPDVLDPTNSLSNIVSSAHCQSCHTNTWNGTTSTCSDPAYTTASSCTSGSTPTKYTGNINHSGGANTPMDRVGVGGNNATKAIEFACITCHMGPDLNHLVRINTSAAYSVNPGGSGDVLANTSPDGTYNPAVWMELDTACGQCHGGGTDGSGNKVGVSPLSRTKLAAMAPYIHGTWNDVPDGSCTTCHNGIVPGTSHHGASTNCRTCHTDHGTVPPTTDAYCVTCHSESVSMMSHPKVSMFTSLTCAGCHDIPNTTYPGAIPNPKSAPCRQCHGGGTNPIDNPPTSPVFWRSDAYLADKANGIHQITPDLVISYLTVPSMASPGQTISVSDITKNRIGMADPSTTAFYLSTTNDLSGQVGGVLATRPVPALWPNSTDPGTGVATTSVTILGGTPVGTYYIIAKADDGGVVAELNETNNTRASGAISVVANNVDLVISSVAAPTSARKGTTISLTDFTKNRLTDTAGASTTAAYLSATCSTTPSGSPIGSRSVPSLGSGAGSTGTISATIPSGTVAGSYYLIWNANNGHTIVETDYTNNTKCKAITITN